MQQYNKYIQFYFYWCYISFDCFLTKKVHKQESQKHAQQNGMKSALSLLRSSHGHGTIHFFSETPVSVQLVDRLKRDTMGNDYMPMT